MIKNENKGTANKFSLVKKKNPYVEILQEINKINAECHLDDKEIHYLYTDIVGMDGKTLMKYVKEKPDITDEHFNQIMHDLATYRMLTKAKKKREGLI